MVSSLYNDESGIYLINEMPSGYWMWEFHLHPAFILFLVVEFCTQSYKLCTSLYDQINSAQALAAFYWLHHGEGWWRIRQAEYLLFDWLFWIHFSSREISATSHQNFLFSTNSVTTRCSYWRFRKLWCKILPFSKYPLVSHVSFRFCSCLQKMSRFIPEVQH